MNKKFIVCPEVKFLFFDGIKRMTVMFQFGLKKWFIFNETEETNALFVSQEILVPTVDLDAAEDVLYEYLNSL